MPDSPSNTGYNVGVLEERVTGLERTVGHISSSVDNIGRQVAGVAGLGAAVEALSKKFDERQKFPYGAATLGVAVIGLLGAVITFGFMAYINGNFEALNRISAQVQALDASSVSRTELEERRQATADRIARLEMEVGGISDGVVPRGEHEEHWRSQAAEVANLQRQVDQIRTEFGSSYSLNDALTDLQSRLDRLEQLRLQTSQAPN